MSLPQFINREKWIVLGMLWLVCLLNYADRQAISSLFPLLERDYGFTKAQLGLIGSALCGSTPPRHPSPGMRVIGSHARA